MPTTDRRRSPRIKLDQLAYLNIEPDNGGIVLNVSEEGLCFRSMGPVQSDGQFHLSLQEPNRKIDIGGELVWTDDLKKSGGVRFNTLTKEARDRISDWTQQSEAGGARSTLGAALLKALPSPDARRFERSFRPAIAWWKSDRRVRISGFTRGLAVGFLLSLGAFSLLLFSYQHRAGFGESLIRIGQRLTGNQGPLSTPHPTSSPIVPAGSPSSASTVSPLEPKSPVKARSHDASLHADAEADDVTVRLLTPPRRAEITPTPAVRDQSLKYEALPPNKGPVAETNPLPPAKESANASVAMSSESARPVPIPKPDPPVKSVHSEAAPSLSHSSTFSEVQMFFDLGRFKKEPMAQDLREKLGELGIESTVVSKRRLWGSSYQVLAGPYDDHDGEKQIYTALLLHGYKPRPFERGTRDFALRSRLTIDGSLLPSGNFTVAWESYIADAKVKFTQGKDLLAAVDGKWVKHTTRFAQNEYVYQVQPDGSRPLLELHFGGMDRALVFRQKAAVVSFEQPN
jgi:hypothetical protein